PERRLAPLREVAKRRLCRLAAGNRRNLDFPVMLPMTCRAPIMRAALELHDLDLLAAALVQDLALHFAAGHEGRADPHIGPVADEQNLIEIDDVSNLGIQALDAQLVAGAHAVLLIACT